MKRSILFVVFGLVCSVSFFGQSVTALGIDLESDLVLHYTFDGDDGTNVWAASGNGNHGYCGPIEFELRTGAKSRELGDLETALSFSTHLDFTRECWCRAAVLEKTLRSKGVTVPRDDVFVAAAALFYDVTLLTADPHFELMRTRGRIKLRLV